VPLHLSGRGSDFNRRLAVAGRDSFDGLEWCQTVVTSNLHSSFICSHADFFRAQTNGEMRAIVCCAHAGTQSGFFADWMTVFKRCLPKARAKILRGELFTRIYLSGRDGLDGEGAMIFRIIAQSRCFAAKRRWLSVSQSNWAGALGRRSLL